MPYGISDIQLLTFIAPITGALITTVVYQFAYDKKENARVAAEAESERWDDVKRHYGRMVSTHHTAIVNSANTFIDLSDPDDSAEAMESFLSNTEEFEELEAQFSDMKRPSYFHKWCRRGAEYSPWAFIGSTGLILMSVFVKGIYGLVIIMFASVMFLIALVLTVVFLYFRSKMNGVADDLQFRT